MKICFIEIDDRTRQSLILVLSHRANEEITMADGETADIAVLDLDRESALATYRSLHARRPELRAIGLTTVTEMPIGDIVALRKPVSPGRLLDSIQQLKGGEVPAAKIIAAGAAGSLSARKGNNGRRLEATDTSVRDDLHFDPSSYLLGTLLDAAADAEKGDGVAVVSFYGNRVIVADRKNNALHTNLSSAQARAFAFCAADRDATADTTTTIAPHRSAIEHVTRAEADSRFGGKLQRVSWEIFMWSLGAMTSRGRLPQDTKASDRVFLRRWPNMTRFAHSNNDMRILAYWMRQATSMEEIVDALDVPQREAFKVYTAAFAAGLAGKAHREVDAVWEAPEVVEHKERGVFASILQRLLQRKPVSNDEVQEIAA